MTKQYTTTRLCSMLPTRLCSMLPPRLEKLHKISVRLVVGCPDRVCSVMPIKGVAGVYCTWVSPVDGTQGSRSRDQTGRARYRSDR